MNIFWLDSDIKSNAQMHVDKHVVKMMVEYAQLLNSAYYFTNQEELAVYKLSHRNHPCAIWVRQSSYNWQILRYLGIELYNEYHYRYGDYRVAKSGEVIKNLTIPNLPKKEFTRPPQCMPDECKTDNFIKAYRNYYNDYKTHIFKWTGRDVPYWIERE